MKNIYLDNAATTPVDPEVYAAMQPYLSKKFGNPSSIHNYGKEVKVMIEEARETIADFLGVKPKEIFFTSGGTESNNTAIKGTAFRNIDSDKKHIITSTIEHPSVYETVHYLRDRFNFAVSFVKPDTSGRISPEKVIELINVNTFLISVMHSNNETGLINDIKTIAEVAKEKNIALHSDTVQSIGKVKFSINELNVDFASSSAHKIYGPKGIGFLYIKEGNIIDKFIHGGSQERNMRGGTENISLIAGMQKVFQILKEKIYSDIIHYKNLRKNLTENLRKIFGDMLIFNSSEEESLPNIVNLSFNTGSELPVDENLIIKLDLKGICVSSGSACSSGSIKPSRILLEMGRDKKTAGRSIRISFGRYNTEKDVRTFLEEMRKILNI